MSGPDDTAAEPTLAARTSRRRRAALGSAWAFGALCLLAAFAPLLSSQNPYDLTAFSIMDSRLPPGWDEAGHSFHLLGTDGFGRDMLSAILYGLRISLVVGLLACTIAALVGTSVGLLSGYLGGWVDALVMRIVDLQLALPAILIGLVLLAVLGRGPDKIVLALVSTQWVYFARTVRGSVLVERDKDYVSACRMQGFRRTRILFRHILPNVLPAVGTVAAVSFAAAISLEATLSFLGVGMPVTEPSLGLLIANGFSRLMNGEYWISIFPGVTLLLVVTVLNLMSDGIQDLLNPMRR